MKRYAMGCLALVLAGCAAPVEEGAETRPEGEAVLSAAALAEAKTAVTFVKHVKPILEARCLYCHNGKEMPGKFDLSTRATAMAAGASGPRIVPGNAEGSLLIAFISTGNHGKSMPAVGTRVSPEEIEVLRQWINVGAQWPAGEAGRLKGRE